MATSNGVATEVQYGVFDPTEDAGDSGFTPNEAYRSMIADITSKEAAKQAENPSYDQDGELLPGKKKTFVADNGIRYCWDDEEECWIEDTEFHDNEGDHDKEDHDSDEESDDDDQHQAGAAESKTEGAGAAQKRKRNKKKKPKKVVNNWVYVSGLPLNVTVEEVKDHFSKV
jgi:hypothetical protein